MPNLEWIVFTEEKYEDSLSIHKEEMLTLFSEISQLNLLQLLKTLCSKARLQIGMLSCKFYRYSDYMWHSSAPILNMQLLFGILISLRAYKNFNLFSILDVDLYPKDGMMPIVTCCTP